MWTQKLIELPCFEKGCHLITETLVKQLPELRTYHIGIAHFFLQHTSASLTINENYDRTVRLDMEDVLQTLVPENEKYRHIMEGRDDMVKSLYFHYLNRSFLNFTVFSQLMPNLVY
jgi:secondary thiamine-phosphate synthase enzyme